MSRKILTRWARHAPRLALISALFLSLPSPSRGQAGSADYDKPQLVRSAKGHYATVRDLLFAPDGMLLSGGMDKVIHVWNPAKMDGPVRTIRLPMFRGPRGAIWSMDILP